MQKKKKKGKLFLFAIILGIRNVKCKIALQLLTEGTFSSMASNFPLQKL